jgi:hypothetical protein
VHHTYSTVGRGVAKPSKNDGLILFCSNKNIGFITGSK